MQGTHFRLPSFIRPSIPSNFSHFGLSSRFSFLNQNSTVWNLQREDWNQFRSFAAKTAEKKSDSEKRKGAGAAPKKKREKDAKQLKKELLKKEAEAAKVESTRTDVMVNRVQTSATSTADLFTSTIQQLEANKDQVVKKKQPDALKKPKVAKGWKVRQPNEATAVAKELRVSVKKLNQLCAVVRGLTYRDALIQLKLSERRIAKKVAGLVDSCRFNAENIHNLDPNRLIISELWTGRSTWLKRIRYHSRGRAGVVHKPRTNLYLVMKEVEPEDKRLLSKAEVREKKFLERVKSVTEKVAQRSTANKQQKEEELVQQNHQTTTSTSQNQASV